MTRRRSKDGRDGEAIARDGDAESWRINEIYVGVAELDDGRSVPHAAVVAWLRSWGLRGREDTSRVTRNPESGGLGY